MAIHLAPGVNPGFSKGGGGGGGGGLTVICGRMAMARGRVRESMGSGSFCHVYLTFVAKFNIFEALCTFS